MQDSLCSLGFLDCSLASLLGSLADTRRRPFSNGTGPGQSFFFMSQHWGLITQAYYQGHLSPLFQDPIVINPGHRDAQETVLRLDG